jgi:transposase
MYLRDKVSLHEITKRTGLSRNTVRRWLRTPEALQLPVYIRAGGFGKVSGFTAQLEQSLKTLAKFLYDVRIFAIFLKTYS